MNNEKEMDGLKECQYCAEMVSNKAKKCKHCGELLDPVLREIEFLKQQRNQNLVVNNNNNNNGPAFGPSKKDYPWGVHLLMTLLTGGLWIVAWVLFYIFRDRRVYN